MMDEVNYRVVRGILSAKANTQVQQVEINLDDLQQIGTSPSSGEHPLFRQKWPSDGPEEGIKVIRVK
jgi:hypothetical protein